MKRIKSFDQGVKCTQHENGRGGTDATEEEGKEAKDKENFADKFRHHPIYRLSLGQVNTNNSNTNITNNNNMTLPVWPWSDSVVSPASNHLLQRRPPRPLYTQ